MFFKTQCGTLVNSDAIVCIYSEPANPSVNEEYNVLADLTTQTAVRLGTAQNFEGARNIINGIFCALSDTPENGISIDLDPSPVDGNQIEIDLDGTAENN